MKTISRLMLGSLLTMLVITVGRAQSGISIKYIHDYVMQSHPKVGVVFSYDSIFLEATLADITAKGGLGEAMLAGLAVQTVASRVSLAPYEAVTGSAISKIAGFNVAYVDQNDDLVRGSDNTAKANALAKNRQLGLLVHVIFGGKFTKADETSYVQHQQVTFRFYVSPSSGLQPNYLDAKIFEATYVLGSDDSQKDATPDQLQKYMADQNLLGYVEALGNLKILFETPDYFSPKPVGMVRKLDDKKRVIIETNIPVEGESGLGRTLGGVANVYTGNYGGGIDIWRAGGKPYSFTEGMVVASVRGDNPMTPWTETSYRIPIAELIARDGDSKAATCAVRKLPGSLDESALIGMAVVAEPQAGWYFDNPEVPSSLGSIQIDKSKPVDETFLRSEPEEMPPLGTRVPIVEVADKDGFSWPLPAYEENTRVLPPTTFENDASSFALEKISSIEETVAALSEKGFKIGVVFCPYQYETLNSGILRLFSDEELDQFIAQSDKISGTTMPGDTHARLSSMNLVESTIAPTDGKLLSAGQDIVKVLNDHYKTSVFELIDPTEMPSTEAGIAAKSKLLSKISGDALQIVDLSKTQYKLIANYPLRLDKNQHIIQSAVDIYRAGGLGLIAVGASFRTVDTRVNFPLSGSPDAQYDDYIAKQKSMVELMADGMWENKALSKFSFTYADKAMLHPPTVVNKSAKPNIIPKKEKTLLEKVRRYETEGNKIGIIIAPTAIVAEKSRPATSTINPEMAADTIDCIFPSGHVPFSDEFLYLGQKIQSTFNDAFGTDIFQVIDPDVMPTKKGLRLSSVVPEEVPAGFGTQFKTIVTLEIAGGYSIRNAETSNISVSTPSIGSDPDSKEGKYEMALSVYSQMKIEEYDEEKDKDKTVASNRFQVVSDRFLTKECPTGVDDFVKVVGPPQDFYPKFEMEFESNMDKVIKRETK